MEMVLPLLRGEFRAGTVSNWVEDGKEEGEEVPERYLEAGAQFPFVAFYRLPALADVSEFMPEEVTDESQDPVNALGRVEIRLGEHPSTETQRMVCIFKLMP